MELPSPYSAPPLPIQRKKVNKPSTPPLTILLDHQLRGDLQLLVLNRELSTLYSNSFGRTDSVVFDKLNKSPFDPLSHKPSPRLYFKASPPNVFKTNKSSGRLKRGFTVRDLSSA